MSNNSNTNVTAKERRSLVIFLGLIPVITTVWLVGSNVVGYAVNNDWRGNAVAEVIGYTLGAAVLSTVVYSIMAAIAWAIANAAEKKGRNWVPFFILSLLFPIITAIVIGVVSTDQANLTSGVKKCPKCAEVVKEEAIICKHCGSEF